MINPLRGVSRSGSKTDLTKKRCVREIEVSLGLWHYTPIVVVLLRGQTDTLVCV